MRKPFAIVAACSLGVASACHKSPTAVQVPIVVCPAIGIAGLIVHVHDGQTGLYAASGSTVVARSGTYADSLRVATTASDSDGVWLAANRPGTYDVIVRKTGYLDWTQTGVVVVPGAAPCPQNVTTTNVDARLQRSPQT
jgi:hypothetical protein